MKEKIVYHKLVKSNIISNRYLCNKGKYFYPKLAQIQWRYVTCKDCLKIGEKK